ncbi:Curlin associated repeat-containing protein [Flavobacterium fryxellicola]|uniref:Curlin n=1 Tax=Flavobacterium fryxellicola TaxID=249352 RepID=A0A167UJD7_9FLAO|nr:hypothetical protein [Flavobacterium fryxellicola]OAB25646.1 hypothetical protein FBFR_14160 [Flavobacterium fryxellicola]SHN73839.1 Curlin associated repeat-containing protein [Flavobacterium fryxellicola]
MKKVVLSISAMLCTVAISYAQPGPVAGPNVSAVGQTGFSQFAQVSQIGTAQNSKVKQELNNNDAYVYQGVNPGQMLVGSINTSAKNMADIFQRGDDNYAYISQNNWNNMATQSQRGDRNDATIWQDEVVVATASLDGHDKATQTQRGNDNEATIDQGTSGNNPLPTVATFTLGVPLTSAIPFSPHGYNEATQTQRGNWNKAYTSQGGRNNDSDINQNSVGKAATIVDRNVANHYQYGRNNDASTTQMGYRNLDNILQEGNNNRATTMQTGNTSGNMNSTAQQGNSNVANVNQAN